MANGVASDIEELKKMDIFDFWRYYIAREKDIEEKIKLQKELNNE